MHRRFLGRTARDQWRELAHEFGVELPVDFHARRVRDAKAAMSARLKPVAGVPETLPRLGQRMTCASNSEKAMLVHKLDVAGILHHFGDRTISYEEVARPKPAPDMYLEAVARSGLPLPRRLSSRIPGRARVRRLPPASGSSASSAPSTRRPIWPEG